MAYLLYIRNGDDKDHGNGGHGLGLGWLLGIALGGAALLFVAIGLLLAWRIRSRNQPCTTRVYALPEANSGPASTTRLAKRRLLASEYSTSRFSSRLSLSLPPILPPLPTYNSFNLLGNRRRSKSWLDEDTLHGPKVTRGARNSLLSMDTWLGRVPTLPSLDAAEKGQQQSQDAPQEPRHEPQPPQPQELQVQKRQSRPPPLTGSQTAPMMATEEDAPRGRDRVPAQTHVKPSLTDTDLRDILQLTERRLRDGTSRSPTKTPRGSPTKGGSPTKTPRSYRTASSSQHATPRTNRGTPSPSKRGAQTATPRTTPRSGASRNASVNSIGSAANSLIAEATQQLELPGGMSSPSRLRGSEWAASGPELPMPPPAEGAAQERRRSEDSDVSSSLSTLYSVGEPEEGGEAARGRQDDPFVEDEVPIPVPERNPLRRKTMSAAVLSARSHGQSPVPAPLRPLSVNSQPATRTESVKETNNLPIVLQPPTRPVSEDVGPKSPTPAKDTISATSSESSMVTETVHSDSESELPVIKASKPESDDDRSQTPSPSTIRGRGKSADLLSSPYDEQDILSIILSSSRPKRALPVPPSRTDGTGELATALSPRPRSSGAPRPTHSRKPSNTSVSSSNYSDPAPGASITGSPPPPRRTRSARERESQAVGSTIAQLRRMNSMVSSYSTASVASTATTVVGADSDSPSLPTLRSGTFSSQLPRSGSKPGGSGTVIGSRHYLNVGTARSKSKNGGRRDDGGGDQDHGKENVGLGLRVPRGDGPGTRAASPGLREGRRSGNLGRGDGSLWFGRAKLGPVDELMAEDRRRVEQRDSVESLYDKDGFLIGSPERSPDREAKGRCLRM